MARDRRSRARSRTASIHPPSPDGGLAVAIREVAARSTVPATVGDLPSGRFDAPAETTAYYVFAEAVTNAQKHADASSIYVAAPQ